MADWTTGGLWLAIIGSGAYHGVNPGMGWPLAVSAAMLIAGGAVAVAVHRWLGPQFIARSWFNLEILWAASLVLVGGIGLAAALAWG